MEKFFDEKQGKSLWEGKFALWEGGGAYFGNTFDTKPHQHHAIQICIALKGSFRLKNHEENDWLTCELAIIDSNVSHQIDGSGVCLLLIYLDPEQRLSRAVRKKMANERIFLLPSSNEIRPILKQLKLNTNEKTNLLSIVEKVLASLLPNEKLERSIDPRIEKVISTIKSMAGTPLAAIELAQIVGLSESRLAHLFNEQTGIPIRRYILWVRLQKAIVEMIKTNSLTEVAHASGFADSAHFTRTFRRMFGIVPSSLNIYP